MQNRHHRQGHHHRNQPRTALGQLLCKYIDKHSPKLLIFAGRNTSKCEETANAIRSESPGTLTRVLELDLGSLAQVRKAAAKVNSYPEPIGVLCNNAGVMATPYTTTTDALESQFAIDHVGHFSLLISSCLSSWRRPMVPGSSL